MTHYQTKDRLIRSRNIYRNTYHGTTENFSMSRHLFSLWKGTCFKLIWRDFLIWSALYTILSLIYRIVLYENDAMRQFFELICIYANRFASLIPLTFLTGFYVSAVLNRWWDQFMSLPWPDQLALRLASSCPGSVSLFSGLTITFPLLSGASFFFPVASWILVMILN